MKDVRWMTLASLGTAVLALTGCVAMPVGPSMTVLPGTNKNFDQFRADDASCRQYAFGQIGGGASTQAGNETAIGSAVVGTALGAAVGAAVGGGSGAAVGAGVGLLTGSAVGASSASYAGYDTQQRYDASYVQCMYAAGNRVPVYGRSVATAPRYASPAPTYYYPPPPPPPGYAY
jgi:hypothetical protein